MTPDKKNPTSGGGRGGVTISETTTDSNSYQSAKEGASYDINGGEIWRKARARGVLKIGKCNLAQTKSYKERKPLDQHTLLSRLRLSEIDKLMKYRHGRIIPDLSGTDDIDLIKDYIMAVAGSGGHIEGWCHRWAPWFDDNAHLEVAHRLALKLANSKNGPRLLSGQRAAEHLHLTFQERTELDIRTIGSCDVNAKMRKRIAAQKKKLRDRERQRIKRKQAGCTPRNASISATKPWIAEGISRRTWYRKRNGTNSSHIEVAMLPHTSTASDETVPTLNQYHPGKSDQDTTVSNVSRDRSQSSSFPKSIVISTASISSPSLMIAECVAKRSRGLGDHPPSGSTEGRMPLVVKDECFPRMGASNVECHAA